MLASVAQLVEQRTENPRVAGSIPAGGTKVTPDGRKGIDSAVTYADVAHLVERHLAKVEVAGSSPVIRSTKKVTFVSLTNVTFFELSLPLQASEAADAVKLLRSEVCFASVFAAN